MEKSKMIEQLEELLEMQNALDENIMKERGITEYPESSMKVALFVELGELLNEFPTKFKHWKASAVDNREKGLEEMVDVLHFALSLYNHGSYALLEKVYSKNIYEEFKILNIDELFVYLNFISESLADDETADLLITVFALSNRLGFTWDEIYQAYKDKNEINYQRLKNGY